MAEECSMEASSSSQVNGEEPEVEINIKTLDSQIYSFRVKKNMRVSLFKEKVASTIGVPVGQQRLIFRGKVLKDDHLLSEYHIEDRHTLHLVERQPVQVQNQPGTNSTEHNGDNDTQGNDSTATGPRGRIGQVSHSVVLGTFNVGGDQGGVVPDLSRIIGAVLNSVGIGNPTATGGTNNMSSVTSSNSAVQTTQSAEAAELHGGNGVRDQNGNQGQSGQGFMAPPFQSLYQSLQLPLTGGAVAFPPQNMVIPDALTTLTQFINRMQVVLSGSQSSLPADGQARPDTASPNTRGLPTAEALGTVVRRAQQLLSEHAGAALSNIAGRLETEGFSTDARVRAQIQAEALQVGVAMQHLGALLLELGRTIMTLRMGQSPAESVVNAGPAVYISPSGPNPIMPFPFQMSSLFGVPSAGPVANTGILSPVGMGDVHRNINIHIHAGSSVSSALSSVGSRTNNGETNQAQSSGIGTGLPHELPARNIVAAIPARSPVDASGHVLNVIYPVHARSRPTNLNSSPQTSLQGASPTVPIGAQPNMGNNVQLAPQSVSTSSTVTHLSEPVSSDSNIHAHQDSSRSSERSDEENQNSIHLAVDGDGGAGALRPSVSPHVLEPQNRQLGNDKGRTLGLTQGHSVESEVQHLESRGDNVTPPGSPGSSKDRHPGAGDKSTPLGLGSGGLQLKRRSMQPKSQEQVSGTDSSSSANQTEQSIAQGQQVLQSLISRGASNQNRSSGSQSAVQPPISDQFRESLPSDAEGGDRGCKKIDAASLMSQVLASPAIDNLLSGVSQQAGFIPTGGLRGMLEQITESPSMRNAINQFAEQVDGNMVPGFESGQHGPVDMSRMFQQLMPVLSEALGGMLNGPAPTSAPTLCEEPRDDRDDKEDDKSHEIDLRQAVQSIEHGDPPANVLRSVAESANHLYGEGNIAERLIDEICSDGLEKEYMEMLRRDIASRFQFESESSTGGS
ncbi:ubiquitin-like domain-containing protein CIP73 isoform X2 [Aristolochia californica]|uniref:ubiquitin-like domain-containing protein CIP73 isoform X2 n=1 Tax=Aristolochia californica TaxID=171875 RepID=UPI0035DD916B